MVACTVVPQGRSSLLWLGELTRSTTPSSSTLAPILGALIGAQTACTQAADPDGIVVADGQQASGLAIDSTNLYWTNLDGSVMTMTLQGSSPIALATGLATRPSSIAVDEAYVYWTNLGSLETPTDGSVMKVPLDGGPATILASGQYAASAIAVDADRVYWVSYNSVYSVPLGGGAVVPLYEASVPVEITGLAVDATAVYWHRGSPIHQALSGGAPVAMAANVGQGPGSLALDATNVYWTVGQQPCDTNLCEANNGAVVMKVSKTGGAPETLASFETPGYPVTQLAVDATHIYWTSAHELQRMSIDGGPVESLASNQGSPHAMVLSTTDVYWASGAVGDEPPAIRMISK